MTVAHMEINHEARAIFARNWVDMRYLDIAATGETLHIRGRMVLLTESQLDIAADRDRSGVGPRFLKRLEEDLLKISSLHFVHWELEGWHRIGTGWRSGTH